MRFLWETNAALERFIVIQRIGETPPNVDKGGGYSVWFWDSADGESRDGQLKISYPIQSIEKLQRDGNYQYIRLHCAYNKVYMTRLSYNSVNDLEDLLRQRELQQQQQQGSQKVGQARTDQQQQRRVG